MKKVGIIGASGYTGYELVKMLTKHPEVELIILNSRSNADKKVSELYPDFDDKSLEFTSYTIDEINSLSPKLLFLALPNGEAMKIVPQLKKKIKVIDLSADYRFKKPEQFEKIYKIEHLDKGRKAVFGLPELFKDKIKKAKLVANPGCYVTASILAALPIQKLAKYIVFDCKSGYSGAGKNSVYAEDENVIKDNIVAYKLTDHRHKYEMEQFLKTKMSFTPHVIDTFRGLMCTMHAILKKPIDKESMIKIYKDYYDNKDFVKIKEKLPELHDVQNSNLCSLGGFEIDENNQLVVISVLDNLMKGASGQAVQNMNIMLGFDEEAGLK
jgi:N-acetyl-gamma-glutamyl-phosphate reductase